MTSTPEGTVRVAREGARGFHFIDKAKYDASPGAFVVLGDDGEPITPERDQPDLNAPRIAKGPGGKFYIKTGKKNQAGPFQTEAEAQAALDEANSVTPDGTPTPVPDEWEAMTDDEILALAEALSGGPVTASGEESPVDRAKSIIRATVEDRASRG